MHNAEAPSEHQINPDHVRAGGWKIPLVTRKNNLKKGSHLRDIDHHVFGRATGPPPPKGPGCISTVAYVGLLQIKGTYTIKGADHRGAPVRDAVAAGGGDVQPTPDRGAAGAETVLPSAHGARAPRREVCSGGALNEKIIKSKSKYYVRVNLS
eukprot:1194746-Prorocentrum_minimum.AAC.2